MAAQKKNPMPSGWDESDQYDECIGNEADQER
jgi:hypothetical protein